MIDWETVRDAYLERFGPLRESHEVLVPDREPLPDDLDSYEAMIDVETTLRCFLLAFQRPEQPAGPIVYASFGAASGGCGDEVFLTATTPFRVFDDAVEHLAGARPGALLPLQIVRFPMMLSSFEALFVLPAGDGTFPLGELDGTLRHALRVVPLTRAERSLGELDPARLLDLLRAAGALVVDPFRACVIEPERDGGRRANLAAMLRDTRRSVRQNTERLERLRELNAPDVIVENAESCVSRRQADLDYLESRRRELLPEPEPPELLELTVLSARINGLVRDLLGASVDPYTGLVPPHVGQLFRAFMFLLLTRHPVVDRLVYEAVMGEGRERPNDAPMEDELEQPLEGIVSDLSKIFPEMSPGETLARGRAAAQRARSTFDPQGDEAWEVVAWSSVVPEICREAAPLDPADKLAVERALRAAGQHARHVDLEVALDPVPARLRLARIVSAASRILYRDFVRAGRREARVGSTWN